MEASSSKLIVLQQPVAGAPCYELGALTARRSPEALELDERVLTAALAQGSAEALRLIYQRHHEAVRAFAQRLIGAEADAEELVQEAFVALPRVIKNFRGNSALRSFVIGVAVNRARHFVRSSARRRRALERLAQEPSPPLPAADQDLEQAELASALTRALDDLPLAQRVAFVLCEVEERTSREAAAIVGVSDSTLRARVRAAKKRLREWFARKDVP